MKFKKQKFEEAKYFLSQMHAYAGTPKEFYFNLSAFLSAARSVTFVMQEEYSNFPKFNDWYKVKKEEMNNDEDWDFFNKLRVKTIHKKPVMPDRKIEVGITFVISSSYIIENIDNSDKIVSKKSTKSKKTKSIPKTESTVKNLWFFEKKPNVDLFEVCDKHLQKIEKIVEECEKQFH